MKYIFLILILFLIIRCYFDNKIGGNINFDKLHKNINLLNSIGCTKDNINDTSYHYYIKDKEPHELHNICLKAYDSKLPYTEDINQQICCEKNTVCLPKCKNNNYNYNDNDPLKKLTNEHDIDFQEFTNHIEKTFRKLTKINLALNNIENDLKTNILKNMIDNIEVFTNYYSNIITELYNNINNEILFPNYLSTATSNITMGSYFVEQTNIVKATKLQLTQLKTYLEQYNPLTQYQSSSSNYNFKNIIISCPNFTTNPVNSNYVDDWSSCSKSSSITTISFDTRFNDLRTLLNINIIKILKEYDSIFTTKSNLYPNLWNYINNVSGEIRNNIETLKEYINTSSYADVTSTSNPRSKIIQDYNTIKNKYIKFNQLISRLFINVNSNSVILNFPETIKKIFKEQLLEQSYTSDPTDIKLDTNNYIHFKDYNSEIRKLAKNFYNKSEIKNYFTGSGSIQQNIRNNFRNQAVHIKDFAKNLKDDFKNTLVDRKKKKNIYSNYTLRNFLKTFVFHNRKIESKIWNPVATFKLINNYKHLQTNITNSAMLLYNLSNIHTWFYNKCPVNKPVIVQWSQGLFNTMYTSLSSNLYSSSDNFPTISNEDIVDGKTNTNEFGNSLQFDSHFDGKNQSIQSPWNGTNRTNKFLDKVLVNKFKYNFNNNTILRKDNRIEGYNNNLKKLNNPATSITDIHIILKQGIKKTINTQLDSDLSNINNFIELIKNTSTQTTIRDNLKDNNLTIYNAIEGNIKRLVNECVLHVCHGSRGNSDTACFKAMHWPHYKYTTNSKNKTTDNWLNPNPSKDDIKLAKTTDTNDTQSCERGECNYYNICKSTKFKHLREYKKLARNSPNTFSPNNLTYPPLMNAKTYKKIYDDDITALGKWDTDTDYQYHGSKNDDKKYYPAICEDSTMTNPEIETSAGGHLRMSRNKCRRNARAFNGVLSGYLHSTGCQHKWSYEKCWGDTFSGFTNFFEGAVNALGNTVKSSIHAAEIIPEKTISKVGEYVEDAAPSVLQKINDYSPIPWGYTSYEQAYSSAKPIDVNMCIAGGNSEKNLNLDKDKNINKEIKGGFCCSFVCGCDCDCCWYSKTSKVPCGVQSTSYVRVPFGCKTYFKSADTWNKVKTLSGPSLSSKAGSGNSAKFTKHKITYRNNTSSSKTEHDTRHEAYVRDAGTWSLDTIIYDEYTNLSKVNNLSSNTTTKTSIQNTPNI